MRRAQLSLYSTIDLGDRNVVFFEDGGGFFVLDTFPKSKSVKRVSNSSFRSRIVYMRSESLAVTTPVQRRKTKDKSAKVPSRIEIR